MSKICSLFLIGLFFVGSNGLAAKTEVAKDQASVAICALDFQSPRCAQKSTHEGIIQPLPKPHATGAGCFGGCVNDDECMGTGIGCSCGSSGLCE